MEKRGFRADALLARARRHARMSQRELAVAVGVAPSTVAAIESGARHPSVELLDRLLRASGLRLAVVDADGVELAPFPDEAVRDNAGRRFPAHLDVLPPDRVPPTRVASPRYDRPPAKGWYRLRADAPREGAVGPRADHPTVAEVELARQKTLYGRSPTWPRREATLREAWGLAPGPDDD
nr:helix-turn-helix transcriptional regulator [Phycicoccus sp. Soil802]